MRRVGSVLLVALAVIVLAGAVLVIANNKAPKESGSAPPARPASNTPAPRPSSSSPVAAGRPTVAFLGDDWTSGEGSSATSARFTAMVQSALNVHGVNLGQPGTGYAKATSTAGDYASREASVVAAKPTVVVVSGGRNDVDLSTAAVEAQARALFAALHTDLPDATLIAIAPFWGDSDQPPALLAIATKIEQAVTAVGGTYLDIPDPIHGHPSYMADAADPDDAGYAAIAAALEPQLSPLLG